MDLQDMADAEVYKLGLEILLDKLGPAGRLRFLAKCKPCTGDYTAERHKWIDNTPDIKTIVTRVQERRELKQATPKNKPPKNINDMSDIEVYEFGLKAISLKLGPVGMVRFVHLFDVDGHIHDFDQLKPPNANEQGLETGGPLCEKRSKSESK